MNFPETLEGAQVWELVRSSEGQLRAGIGGVSGLDFAAVLALGEAAGICRAVLSDMLPMLEGVMVRKINERMRSV